jgi:hypothetical protein
MNIKNLQFSGGFFIDYFEGMMLFGIGIATPIACWLGIFATVETSGTKQGILSNGNDKGFFSYTVLRKSIEERC